MDDNAKRALQQQALQTELDALLARAKNNGFVITVEKMVGEVREKG